MNELSVDLDRYFALGRDVSITTLHDEQISGIVSFKNLIIGRKNQEFFVQKRFFFKCDLLIFFLQILAFDKKTTMIVIQCASRVLCLNIRNVKSISTSEDIENDFPAEFHKKC